MNLPVPIVPLVVFIEETNHELVNRLTPQTIQGELHRLVEEGNYEKLDIDLPILRYRNLKPNNIPGKRMDDGSFLLVIDNTENLKVYKVV